MSGTRSMLAEPARGEVPRELVPARPLEVSAARAARRIVLQVDGFSGALTSHLSQEERAVFERGLAHAPGDWRYQEATRHTLRDRFDHWYLVLADGAGRIRAVQPVFTVREDLLAGAPPWAQRAAARVRRVAPRLLTARMFMVGCCAGEGYLARGEDEQDTAWVDERLPRAAVAAAQRLGAGLVVFKELTRAHRARIGAPAARAGFARVASMPACEIDLSGFGSFDDYLARVHSKSRREDLRKKFNRSARRAAELGGRLEMSVTGDLRPHLGEALGLYEQVYARARLRFERLNAAYFERLSEDLSDRSVFFLWRLRSPGDPGPGRLVAFSACLLHTDELGVKTIKDHYIGLDYAVALDLHLYFVSMRDIFSWAMANGVRRYWTAALNYDPKLALKMRLAPLDLYVRHRSGVINAVFKRVIPLFGPTGGERVLRGFENAGEL